MHIALFAAVTAALGLSTLALQQSGSPPVANPPAQTQPGTGLALSLEPTVSGEGVIELAPALSRYAVEGVVELPRLASSTDGDELGTILGSMGEAADARVYIYWNHLEQYGTDAGTMIDAMPFEGQTLEKALSMLSDTLDLRDGARLAFRLDNGLMEIATLEFFDRQELELVGYEVAFLLEAESPLKQSNESDTLTELITTLVEPNVWLANGGYATISVAGNQVFVNTPRRVHDRVAWLLGELAKGTLSSRDPFAPAATPTAVSIEGAVARPGTYQIPVDGEFTLDRLLISAGGLQSDATRIFVRQDSGEGQVIHMVDIGAMRTMTDVKSITLSPRDSVFVARD